MVTTIEEQLYGFYHFPGSKNHWEKKYFLKFWFQEMSLKGEIFYPFLASKHYDKIWHLFQHIL